MKELKMTLQLGDIRELGFELEGSVDPENGKQKTIGILKHDLDWTFKFHLQTLQDNIKKHRDNIDKIQRELAEKYGEKKEDGSIFLPIYGDDGKPNPQMLKYYEEFGKFLETKVEISHPEFVMADFGKLKTNEHFPILNLLVRNGLKKAKPAEEAPQPEAKPAIEPEPTGNHVPESVEENN